MRPGRIAAIAVLVVGVGLVVRAALTDETTAGTVSTSDAAAPAPDAQDLSPDDGAGATADAAEEPVATTTTEPPEPLPVLGTVPSLHGLDGWMNSEVESLDRIRATHDVVVVQFWTFGCRNCKATLDNLRGIYDDHRDNGLEVVGVHSPEFSYEADLDNIADALIDLDVSWPVALDTEKENFHRWQPGRTGYWPRTYVIDGDGNIRFDHVGEGKYDELREAVEQLLDEAAAESDAGA